MRVEIAACLLTFSLAMLVPESTLPPVANPMKRSVQPRHTREESSVTHILQLRALPPMAWESAARRGAETERVDFNKRDETGYADPRGEEQSRADFGRLQHMW